MAKYAIFNFATGANMIVGSKDNAFFCPTEVPVGVVIWDDIRQIWDMSFIDVHEPLCQAVDYPMIDLIQQKIRHWASSELPYATEPLRPYQTEWWDHVRQLLIHQFRLSQPYPIVYEDVQKELVDLYETIIGPYRDKPRTRTITLPVEMLEKIDKLCAERKTTFDRQIELMLQDGFDRVQVLLDKMRRWELTDEELKELESPNALSGIPEQIILEHTTDAAGNLRLVKKTADE